LEEALGWGWKAAIHPEDLGKLMETWQALLVSGQSGEVEARLRRCDGKPGWFLFRAAPVCDEYGHFAKWYETNIEIEDWKGTEFLLAAEKRTLRMIAEAPGSRVSCKIRATPLTRWRLMRFQQSC
jgi:PAS fold